METKSGENVAKPNVFIVKGENNVNRDLNCNEKVAELLSSDLNIEIDIELVKNTEKDIISWGKLLEFLPVFTRHEIDRHAKSCSKTKRKAIKKREGNFRGSLFKQERYLTSDTLYTARKGHFFLAKCCCRTSMKNEKRNALVNISRRTSLVEKASCTCPAGKSGYCNHVMALPQELAEYSLNSLEKVPGDKETVKEPIMRTSIISQTSKKGIEPAIYEARASFNIDENKVSIIEMKNRLLSLDKNIAFSRVIPNTMNFNDEVTIGSPLSYQLLPLEENFKIITNLSKVNYVAFINQTFSDLPLSSLDYEDRWDLSQEEKGFLDTLNISMQKSLEVEKLTRKQRENKLWFRYKEKRIIKSSVAHRIFIRQKKSETLVTSLHTPNGNLPKSVQSAFKYGMKNEIIAKEKYVKAMNFKLFRNIVTEDTGLLIQPNLPWLGASPDGKVLDHHEIPSQGLLEIK